MHEAAGSKLAHGLQISHNISSSIIFLIVTRLRVACLLSIHYHTDGSIILIWSKLCDNTKQAVGYLKTDKKEGIIERF